MVTDKQNWDQMVKITSGLGLLKIFAGVYLFSELNELKNTCPGQVTVNSFYPPFCIALGALWLVRSRKIKKLQAADSLLPNYAQAPEGNPAPVQAQPVDGKF